MSPGVVALAVRTARQLPVIVSLLISALLGVVTFALLQAGCCLCR